MTELLTAAPPLPRYVADIPTPALLVEQSDLAANLATMAAALPGPRLRPHVKAHKTTALARLQQAAGHPGFTCATPREAVGLVAAGLGPDVLLANETLDPHRLRLLAAADVIVAVDSDVTLAAAVDAGVRRVIIDVNVGLPRCGVPASDAGRLASAARRAGREVVGVMGYEGHAQGLPERERRAAECAASMVTLAAAAADVGAELISAGGTGTYDLNTVATEIQAGSYLLMDTAYAAYTPFRPALSVLCTVLARHPDGYAVADLGLKSLGMDHGNPTLPDAVVWFCSDEHTTFSAADGAALPAVGSKLRARPAHVDPTVAYHEWLWLVDGDAVVERWPVDLRGW